MHRDHTCDMRPENFNIYLWNLTTSIPTLTLEGRSRYLPGTILYELRGNWTKRVTGVVIWLKEKEKNLIPTYTSFFLKEKNKALLEKPLEKVTPN